MKRREYTWVILAVLAALVIFLCIITGNFFTKKVALEIGEISPETLYAPFQVENEIATNRKKQDAEDQVKPTYKKDSSIQEKAISNIETLFKYISTIQTSTIADDLGKSKVEVLSGRSPIGLYNEQYEMLLSSQSSTLDNMKTICIDISSEIFKEGVAEGDNVTVEIRQRLEDSALNIQLKKIAEDIITSVIEPNVVVDEVATNEEKKVARDKVDTVYVLPQEKIIEKGSKVTEEVYTLLDKVGYLRTDSSDIVKQCTGVIAIIALMAFLYIYHLNKTYFKGRYRLDENKESNVGKIEKLKIQKNKTLSLVFILFMLSSILVRLFAGYSFVYIPISIVCMVITFAMGPHAAIATHMFVVIISTLIYKGDILFIIYFLLSGIASTLIVNRMHERKMTLISSLYVGGVQAVTFVILKLLVGTTFTVSVITEAVVAFIMGMISVVTVVGVLPVFESMFGFVTPMQLLELTNPNQPILKRLLLEATGTYSHSLLVANLAEAAAYKIGANALLARVGGYYHDIGKLSNSSYFKENQGPQNPHDFLTPEESATIIKSHVSGGVELAKEYKLPNYIIDFIKEHHGTTAMKYFYVQAQNNVAEGEEIDIKKFSYDGPIPQSPETALVMLADVIEATTRAMQDKLGVDIEIKDIVEKTIKEKLEEGQLNACELYISDLDKITEAFTKILTGMYHQRIKYPERREKK